MATEELGCDCENSPEHPGCEPLSPDQLRAAPGPQRLPPGVFPGLLAGTGERAPPGCTGAVGAGRGAPLGTGSAWRSMSDAPCTTRGGCAAARRGWGAGGTQAGSGTAVHTAAATQVTGLPASQAFAPLGACFWKDPTGLSIKKDHSGSGGHPAPSREASGERGGASCPHLGDKDNTPPTWNWHPTASPSQAGPPFLRLAPTTGQRQSFAGTECLCPPNSPVEAWPGGWRCWGTLEGGRALRVELL